MGGNYEDLAPEDFLRMEEEANGPPSPPPPSPIRVRLACSGDMVSESNVKFEGIEEDIEGRDILTFGCPECGEIHRSLRFG
jgi:hypothetical protein